jgi:uncharacterized protein CbrC (UPF0167 family)
MKTKMNNIPVWIKYVVNELSETKPGVFQVKGAYAKDNLKDFHGWCVKNGSFESRYFRNESGTFITIENDTAKNLEQVGLKRVS